MTRTLIPKTNRKFWLLIVGSISITIAAGGYWFYVTEESEIRKQKYEELSSIALIKTEQITHWRADRYADALFHYESPLFNQAVRNLLQNPSSKSLRSQMISRLSVTKRNHKYENVILVSQTGAVIISVDSATTAIDNETVREVANAIAQRSICVCDFVHDSASGFIRMDIVVPIGFDPQHPIAALILRINPDRDLFPLIQWWPLVSKSHETLIVRREGDSVEFLSTAQSQQKNKPLLRLSLADTTIPAVNAILGHEGAFEGKDYRGVPVLASIHRIPDSPWYLIAKMNVDEVFEELRYRGTMDIILFALLIIAASSSIGFILYYRQRNLYRERFRAEAELREAQEEFRTTLYSIGDGVITTDTDGKIRQMNTVAEQLTGWKESQAVDIPIETVFVIHNEETGAPAVNPVQRVLQEGSVVGLANHTVLVSRDGKQHPIADSGAPIFDSTTKKIIGVVLVFRDQTEERRAQRALIESEEKFKQLFEAESDAIVLVDNATGKILEANEAACTLYQYTREELLGKKNSDLSAEPEQTQRITQTTIPDKKRVVLIPLRFHKKKDGTRFPVEITGRFFFLQGKSVHVAAIRDISQRIKVEGSLAKSESFLRVSQKIAKIGSYEFDIKADNWTSTETLNDIFGITESYVKSVEGWSNLIHPDDRAMMLKYLTEEVIGARGEFNKEYRIIRASDKQERWVLGLGGLIMDDNGSPAQMIGVIQDITERKIAELSLKRSEESYRGLFNSVKDAIYIQDADGKFLDVNEGAVAMYGYPREYFIGKTPEFLSAPDKNNIARITGMIRKAFEGTPQQFEFWGKRSNGEIFPKEVRLYKGSYFGNDAIIAVAQDISDRKHADEILRASEERYRKLIDTSPDAIAITDMKGNILFMSGRSIELFGGSNDKAYIGTNIVQWIAPEYREKALKGIHDVFAGVVNPVNQYKMLRDDGSEFFGEMNAAPLLDSEGNPEGMVALIRDVTRRKQSEEYLRTFSLVVDQSPASVVITDKNGIIEYVNNKFVEVTGYMPEEVIGTNPRILQSGRTPRHTYVTMWENISNGRAWRGELLNKKKNGELFWEDVKITPLIDENGGTMNYVALKEDITAKKLATEALERREALEKELVNLSTSFVNLQQSNSDSVFNFVLERVGKFTRVDRAYIFRYDKKTRTVSNTHEWVAEGISAEIQNSQNFSDAHLPNWMELLKRHENIHIPSVEDLPDSWTAEKRIFNEQKIQSLIAVPLLYSSELLGFIGFDSVKAKRTWGDDEIRLLHILADLFAGTLKRLKTEEEKENLEQQVRQIQKLESIGTLASGIAHDFNNILGIIMAHVSVLERLKHDEGKFLNSTETILRTINRGAALVKQILTFARKTSTNLEYVNVNKAVGEVQKMLTETFPKSISITLKLEKAIPILMVDATQFNQSILNLCVNARDAMNDQGSLTITTRLVRGAELVSKFPAAASKDFVAISVKDTGSGIDEVSLEKIFEPFYTTKEKGKGTGLGLSVVYGVMQNHNGFVDVESEVGKGSTFTLYYPIPITITQHEETSERVQTDVKGGTETILFVEDEEMLIDVATMTLKNNGYTVLTAKNGEEGYQLFAKHRDTIDLIISDVGMPVMSGEKMYELIKRLEPSVKIIFATGYIEPSVKESLLNQGAKEFVQKPYEASDFLRKVRDVLDKGGS
ncbi:MAG: PAS domain S-box protein [Bacteroidota bacterium]